MDSASTTTTTTTTPLQGHPLDRFPGMLLISNTPKGRGVFTSSPIPKGTTVEVSPVLIFTPEEVDQHTSQTCLQHYTYHWPVPAPDPSPDDDGDGDGDAQRRRQTRTRTQTQAIALGLGSMFNHSGASAGQNVVWTRDLRAGTIVYTAHRDIVAGEELCISYGAGRLWFADADADAMAEGGQDGKEGSGDEFVGVDWISSRLPFTRTGRYG